MAQHEQLITVVVAVVYPVFPRVVSLYESMALNLPDYKISMQVLVLECPGKQVLHCGELNPSVTIFHTVPDVLPIVHSRNICQRHLQMLMQLNGGVGMVLDDDLVWTLPQIKFERWVNELEAGFCAMALMGTTGDPPIPREYLRAAPLLDFLFHLFERGQAPRSVRTYLAGIKTGKKRPKHDHHDFYAFKKVDLYP